MKAKIFTGILGMILSGALVIASPVFAYDSHYRGGHVDHDYSFGGHVDHEYGNGGYVNHGYSYGGHVGQGYVGPSYYGHNSYYGYGHPSGLFGYSGKDARHHYRRGHQHHHAF